MYFDHEVVTISLRPSVFEKVKALEVDWSELSLLEQAGGGRVGELVGKALPVWEAGLEQPESRPWSSPVCQSKHQLFDMWDWVVDNMDMFHLFEILLLNNLFLRPKHHDLNLSVSFTSSPSLNKMITPEVLGHIRREQLSGIVLNQLPASVLGKRTNGSKKILLKSLQLKYNEVDFLHLYCSSFRCSLTLAKLSVNLDWTFGENKWFFCRIKTVKF